MIAQNDIKVYVAAKRSSAPKLPLREALVTVALECVYEPKTQDKHQQVGNRRRLHIAQLLKRPKQKNIVQACTLYSYEENDGRDKSLSSYIEEQNRLTNSNLKGSDVMSGLSTLSSLTLSKDHMNEHYQIKKNSLMDDILEIESYTPLDLPSLASSDDYDGMEDMTMDTYALIGGTTAKPIPGVIIMKDKDTSGKWWYERHGRISPLIFDEDGDGDVLRDDGDIESTESRTLSQVTDDFMVSDSTCAKDVDKFSQTSCMDNVSSIFGSANVLLCPKDLVIPDDHDLRFTIDVGTDDEIESDKTRQYLQKDELTSNTGTNCPKHYSDLFSLLCDRRTNPEDVKKIIDENLQIVKASRSSDGKLPLHVVCDRELIIEQYKNVMDQQSNDFITACIKELASFRKFLKLIAWCHIEACGKHDRNGDLPCHILSRNFLNWKILFKEKFSSIHVGEIDVERITTISKILTECIDIVLRPISTNPNACSSIGSKGKMLPFHISILYGGSIDVFRTILETFPEGARIALAVDSTTPLMPLDLCEICTHDAESDTKSPLDWFPLLQSYSHDDGMRRKADLIFCFHPSVSHADESRMTRLDEVVKYEIMASNSLSPAIRSYWIWICSPYKVDEEELKKCDDSVDNILSNLEPLYVKKLAYILTNDYFRVMEICRPTVQQKLIRVITLETDKNG